MWIHCTCLTRVAEEEEHGVDEGFAPPSPGILDVTEPGAEELPVEPYDEIEPQREPIAPAEPGEAEDFVPYETLTKKTVEMVKFLGNQFAQSDADSLSFNDMVNVRLSCVS